VREIDAAAVERPKRREIMAAPTAVDRQLNPLASDYYRCVLDHFEDFL
jgi:hypothetical protein